MALIGWMSAEDAEARPDHEASTRLVQAYRDPATDDYVAEYDRLTEQLGAEEANEQISRDAVAPFIDLSFIPPPHLPALPVAISSPTSPGKPSQSSGPSSQSESYHGIMRRTESDSISLGKHGKQRSLEGPAIPWLTKAHGGWQHHIGLRDL